MILPIFASFVLLTIWLNLRMKRASDREEDTARAFWQREHAANNVRKKSLEGLAYITIPDGLLPFDAPPSEPKAANALKRLNRLMEGEEKIVNLTGYSNTDLKLSFGAANLPALSRFDQNYTLLARALQTLAEYLVRKEQTADAIRVLEFAVETKTDISSTYKLLGDLYRKNGSPEKIDDLIPKAAALNSALSGAIVRSLEEMKNTPDPQDVTP